MQLVTGYRYRLEPTPAQVASLIRYGGACRWLWNHVLAYREEAYLAAQSIGGKVEKGTFGYAAMCRYLTMLRRDISWLAMISIEVLQQTLRDMDLAFVRFFKKQTKFPNLKRRINGGSFRFPNPGHCTVEGDWVKLPKLGWFSFRKSRNLPGPWRNITVSSEGRHWFISFCISHEVVDLATPQGVPIALDLGVRQSVTTSMGEAIDFNGINSKEHKRLRFLSRQVSRKIKGSRCRSLASERLAKYKRHFVARRRDAAHKLTTRLARNHSTIIIEDLKVRDMMSVAERRSSFNRIVAGQAFSETRRLLTYKCARYGSQLVTVPSAYTSQTCSQCQYCSPENRKNQAEFKCMRCGYQLNADHNAALNILAAGLAVIARGGSDISLADEPRTHRGSMTSCHPSVGILAACG